MANDDVTALLTRAINRLALVMEKQLARQSEEHALRDRRAEQKRGKRA